MEEVKKSRKERSGSLSENVTYTYYTCFTLQDFTILKRFSGGSQEVKVRKEWESK